MSTDGTNTDPSQASITQIGTDPKQVGLWGLVNSIFQKSALENAVLSKLFPDGKFETLPFGSQITNVTFPVQQIIPSSIQPPIVPSNNAVQNSPNNIVAQPMQSSGVATKLTQAALIALALGGSGLGIAGLLKPATIQTIEKQVQVPINSPVDLTPKYVDGILEWNFNSESGLNVNDTNSSGESNNSSGPNGTVPTGPTGKQPINKSYRTITPAPESIGTRLEKYNDRSRN